MLLITRPSADSVKSRAILRALGFEVFIEPMFEIEYLPVWLDELASYDVVTVTSRHGVVALHKVVDVCSCPRIVAVGDSTMKCAHHLGFKNVLSVHGSVKDLIAYFSSQTRGLKVLYVRGQDVSFDLRSAMNDMGFYIREVIVYCTVASTRLSDKCSSLLANCRISGVLFYSAKTAKIFVELVQDSRVQDYLGDVSAYSMSRRAVHVLETLRWKRIDVSCLPMESSLIELLSERY